MSEQTYPTGNEQEPADKPEQPMAVQATVPVAQAPAPPAPASPAPPKVKKPKKGVPGITGFGFTSALLSLFLMLFYKEAFDSYLLCDGTNRILLHYHYYATIVLGGSSALLALFGLILSPFGVHLSRRRESDGRALGISAILIALVALLLIAGVTVSHVLLHGWFFPN